MISRAVLVAAALLALAACATRGPVDERSTQGPTAEEMWTSRMLVQNRRQPTFEERRHWDAGIEARIGDYLRRHPEAASALDVSTFRFRRQAAVGMTREQVLILLGRPEVMTAEAAELERLAGRHWPAIREAATEAWTYPLGWRLYFDADRLVDVTRRRD